MISSDRSRYGWSGFLPSRRRCATVVASSFPALLVALVTFTVAAQAPRRVPQPLQLAGRAFLEGRYDDVDQLTDKLDARDPTVAALTARAASARRPYAQAEAALRPV